MNLINKTKEDFNQTNPAKFDSSFTMVLLNGSGKHSHRISNFSLTDVKDENDTKIIYWTCNRYAKGWTNERRPYRDQDIQQRRDIDMVLSCKSK